jgi:hypothetical protein
MVLALLACRQRRVFITRTCLKKQFALYFRASLNLRLFKGAGWEEF